ncbi:MULTISPECIES: hypothetical protein [unclassified Moraxella]|uniref:hypothetical protein n=1 Tax=unclassified Moraxella TaxID=2685852 RepID=UPI003AF726C8
MMSIADLPKNSLPTPRQRALAKRLPIMLISFMGVGGLVGCQQAKQPSQTAESSAQSQNTNANIANNDNLVGCYTVSHSEPAQIKISKATTNGDNNNTDGYAMQMRQFNDPSKDWDKPEPMQVLANNNSDIQKYFDIKADENKYLEKVIARPDRMFVLAKVTEGFANLNPQFDSPYLGYIYKGSNTVYKVSCDNTQQL